MSPKPSGVELADTVSDLMYGVAGWLLVLIGGAALFSGTGGIIESIGSSDMIVPVVVLLFGFILSTTGLLVNPRFRRRLDRRHDVSRFGQVQTVDSRVLSESENRTELCTGCGSSLSKGLVRRYRQEYALAGVPIWTTSEDHNFYCPNCATEELPGLVATGNGEKSTDEQIIAETE